MNNKKFYPIYLELKDRNCLVVGGGKVGYRKAKTLLSCDANVRLISPKVIPQIRNLKKNKNFSLVNRKFSAYDLKDVFLIIAATNDSAINKKIWEVSLKRNILVNVVDAPALCNFIVPSIVKSGRLTIAISTAGISPGLSKLIRKELQKKYDAKYAKFLEVVGELRKKIIDFPKKRKDIFWKKIMVKYLSKNIPIQELRKQINKEFSKSS